MSNKKRNTTNISLKEFIYIDDTELNSILAQLEDGIPQVIKQVRQSTTSVGESVTSSKSSGYEGKVSSGVLSGETVHSQLNGEETSETNGQMSQEAIETIYSDYAVNIVEKRLDSSNLLKLTSKQVEGAFVKLCSHFEIFDVELLKKFWSSTSIVPLMKQADDYDKSWEEGAENLNNLATILNDTFPDTVFLKLNNVCVLAKTQDFRLSKGQLQSLSTSTRKITVLGKVETIVNQENIDIANYSLEEDLSNLSGMTPTFGTYFLSQFSNLKKDDRLIKPIAIYFE